MNEQQSVRYSRLWERVGAALADTALLSIPMMVLYLWTDPVVTNNWMYWILATLYFVFLEGPMGSGQTLGKRLFGLRVLSKEGRILSYAQSLKRYLILSILPGLATWIGFEYSAAPGFAGWAALAFQETATLYSLMDVVVLANDRQKRALHDYLSGTVVLKTRATIPETWPVNVEPLALLFPWQRQWPGMALVTLFVGMLLALDLGLRPFSGRRPGYIYSQILTHTGVHVDGVRLQGDRVELDVVIPSYPFMGAVSRRPARVSRRLELATRRLIARSVIDPKVVHQVVYWVRASIFSKTGPADRWVVDTQTLAAAFSDAEALERAINSTDIGTAGKTAPLDYTINSNVPHSTVQEFNQTTEEKTLKEFVRKSAVIALIDIKRLTPQYRDPRCWSKDDLEITRYLKGMGSNEAASFLSGSSVCHKDVSGPGEYVAVDWYDSPAVFKTVDSIAIVDEAARAHQWHEIYFFPVNRTGMIAWSAKRAQERQWIPLTAMENAINSHQ